MRWNLCKYSSRCAQLIGNRDPVAMLATLILLSYAYFLCITLEVIPVIHMTLCGYLMLVWNFSRQTHPSCSDRTHLIPHENSLMYTIILFLWQCLLHTSNCTMFKWVKNTKLLYGIIELHQAPFKNKTLDYIENICYLISFSLPWLPSTYNK